MHICIGTLINADLKVLPEPSTETCLTFLFVFVCVKCIEFNNEYKIFDWKTVF